MLKAKERGKSKWDKFFNILLSDPDKLEIFQNRMAIQYALLLLEQAKFEKKMRNKLLSLSRKTKKLSQHWVV